MTERVPSRSFRCGKVNHAEPLLPSGVGQNVLLNLCYLKNTIEDLSALTVGNCTRRILLSFQMLHNLTTHVEPSSVSTIHNEIASAAK